MLRDWLREFPSPRATRLGLLLGVPLSILLGPRLTAWAVDLPKAKWSPNEDLTAEDLTGNFKNLKDAVDNLEANFASLKAAVDKPKVTYAATQKSISFGALSCGMTEPMNGNAKGYVTLKNECEKACQSPTAHLCTSEEMSRSAALGLPLLNNTGRYSGAVGFFDGTNYFNDCDGWTNSTSNYYSNYWNGSSGPNYNACNNTTNYHCCD